MDDEMTKLGISTLAACGTEHGATLAMEMQRGMDRAHVLGENTEEVRA